MDFARVCYETKCRFFADNDTEVSIRWYVAPDDAPDFPGWHRFASGNWAYERVTWPGPGEVLGAPRTFRKGATPPTAKGNHICGELEWFRSGVPWPPPYPTPVVYDGYGIPVCCGVAAPAGDGGEELDGAAFGITPVPTVGDGGEDLDGAAQGVKVVPAVGDGGEDLDGAAQGVKVLPAVGDGGEDLDGAALGQAINIPVGDGGEELDGAAEGVVEVLAVGDGGDELDGAAENVFVFSAVGDGGEELDGAAQAVLELPAVGDGGAELDGYPLGNADPGRVGDGGAELDGAAASIVVRPAVGDGGEELNGTPAGVVEVLVVGDGGEELDGRAIGVEPGTTCDTAMPIAIGVEYGPFTIPNSSTIHWFILTGLTGGTYHLIMNRLGAGAPSFVVYQGTSCTDKTYTFSGSPSITPACAVGTQAAGKAWISVGFPGSGASYTFTFDAGPCP